MTKAEMLRTMAQHTGLNRETIKDLMKHGWLYSENDEKATFSKGVVKRDG